MKKHKKKIKACTYCPPSNKPLRKKEEAKILNQIRRMQANEAYYRRMYDIFRF